MSKNIWAKIVAGVALFWIVLWVVSTGFLFLYENTQAPTQTNSQMTEAQIQELLKTLTGTTQSTGITLWSSGDSLTGSTQKN